LHDDIPDDAIMDEDRFNATLNDFIAVYFPAGSRNLVFQGMRSMGSRGGRPTGFSATRLFTRLRTIRTEAMYIPSDGNETLSDNELKNIAYSMLNTREQVEILRKYNNDITQATLAQLMQDVRNEEYIQSVWKEQLKGKKQGSSSRRNGNSNGSSNGHNHGRRSRNRNNRHGGNDEDLDDEDEDNSIDEGRSRGNRRRTEGPQWGPNSKCRKHPQGNHLWRDCRLNPNSTNYREDRNEQRQGNGNAQRNGNRNNNNNNNQGHGAYGGPTHQGHYYMQLAPMPPQPGAMNPAFAYFGMPPPQHEGAFTQLSSETSPGAATCHDAVDSVCYEATVPACYEAAADSSRESTALSVP